MLKRLALVFALLLAGCATVDHVPIDYAGPDAGKVVLGMGAAAGTSYSSYSLFFRKRVVSANGEKAAVAKFSYLQNSIFFKQAPDYQSPLEAGVILVHSLPPGDYEIFNFDIHYDGGAIQKNFGSRVDFSIPFSVKPGKATYLGNYQANKLTGKNFLGITLPLGAFFVVTDRLNLEFSIAETKTKAQLPAGLHSTPKPSQIGSPFFVSPTKAGDGS